MFTRIEDKMKKIFLLIFIIMLMLPILLFFISCTDASDAVDTSDTVDTPYLTIFPYSSTASQHRLVHTQISDVSFGFLGKIESPEQLEEYINTEIQLYGENWMEEIPNSRFDFLREWYPDEFFENYYLLVIGSGDFRDWRIRIFENGDVNFGLVFIEGAVYTTEVRTDNILIQLSRDFQPESFNIRMYR
jgi:hypothetical protein